MFGAPLAETVKKENSEDGIPLVVKRTITFIEEHYITQDGLFRVAGSKNETDVLKEVFDQGGENAENISFKEKNVHSLGDLLKSYLRSLPEPLLSYEVYDPLVNLMSTLLHSARYISD